MADNPLEALGPPPFRFVPAQQPVVGPSFTRTFKVLCSGVVFGTLGWFAYLWIGGRLTGGLNSIASWFLAGAAMMLYTWWHVVRSTTRLDGGMLHQSWVWDKNMELRELAYGKLIRVPGLDWFIAPRLYVRTLMGKFAVFYAADPAMLAEFERLIRELKAFRGFK
jgi:hypothetical protein